MLTRVLAITALGVAALPALGLLALPAQAQGKPAAEEGAVMLRLSESAVRQVTQDRLRANLRVEIGGADPRSVQGQVNAKMAAALERAKAVGGRRVGGRANYADGNRRRARGG